jgi:hypothetical protein
MADYYPLIARAIAGLEKNSGDARRALYERARAALVAQLRGVSPALNEPDVTRERLALEEAIRKVESEAAHRARVAPPRSEPTAKVRPPDASRWEEAQSWHAPAAAPEPPPLPPARRPVDRRSLLDSGLKDFRGVVSEAKELGEASARASQSARDNLAAVTGANELREASERAAKSARRRAFTADLAEVASPAPTLSPDGRLDAGPNPTYDLPTSDDDFPTLPLRQRALIKTILGDLPGNAPRHLKSALESYDAELQARGAQPILGLLKDMAAIIEAAVGASDAQREWLQEGMQAAFRRLEKNHEVFVTHFPLDPKREELYAQAVVDEDLASGPELSGPFQAVATASLAANKAGLTTDDFAKIVDKLADFAKVISSLPKPTEQAASPGTPSVSATKRILLSGFGFFERAFNLLGSTITIASTPQGAALLRALEGALKALSRFLS